MSTARLAPVLVSLLALVLSGCVVVSERGPGTAPGGRESGGQNGGGQSGGSGQDGGGKAGSGKGYRFAHTRGNGEPVRWSTCQPIRYVVREDGQPEGAPKLLRESIERISEVSGLEFSRVGTTDEAPSRRRPPFHKNRYGDQWSPVLIAYATADEYPPLKGGAAGFGGGSYVRSSGAPPRYVSGSVVLDAQALKSFGSDDQIRAVMLHELAHVVGLGHVNDRSQLMNPVQYGRSVTDLQKGDVAGLEELGQGKCYEPIEPRPIGR